GDVAQKIDPPELGVELAEHLLHLRGVGDVDRCDGRAPAEFFDRLRGLAGAGLVAVHEHQLGARFGESRSHCLAYTASRPADDSNSTGKVEHFWRHEVI